MSDSCRVASTNRGGVVEDYEGLNMLFGRDQKFVLDVGGEAARRKSKLKIMTGYRYRCNLWSKVERI